MNFDELQNKHRQVYLQSGQLYQDQCKLIENSVSLSFQLYSILSKNKLIEKHQYLLAFFYRNTLYSSAAYQLVRMGFLDPAGNNMRTIFETLIWQYAYLTDEEIYLNFKKIDDLESEKMKSLKDKKWSNTKERKLENYRRKYNFQKMMKQIYSKKTYEQFFFNQYWILCQKSHSSIFGLNYNTPNFDGKTTIEKNPNEIKDNLLAIMYLEAENLICLLNCFSEYLQQSQITQIMDFINKINSKIPPALSLAPDTKDLKFSLRFKEL